MSAKDTVQNLLELANIHVGGEKPWDIAVHNEAFYAHVLSGGSLALGESYMDSWWDTKDLYQFFHKLLTAHIDEHIKENWNVLLSVLMTKLTNLQSKKRAFIVGEKHYDIGNDLYTKMLDDRMVYTCAYWKDTNTLDEAQEAKLDLVCRKVGLQKGMRVLDIGCGWGSFAKFAAEKYGVEVVGVTVSKEQMELAKEKCKGLPVEIRLQDYRDIDEEFDAIISLGMFEHVGYKNYRTYMKVAHRCLKDNGLFLLHTIGSNLTTFVSDPWITKYIFPNNKIPSLQEITRSKEGLFIIEDVHNFGNYYADTLLAWFQNFDAHWEELQSVYSERFYRIWKYYLLSCAGSFRARRIQLWQIVLSKNGVPGGYTSIR